MILRRIARPLMGSAFIASGVDTLRSQTEIAQSAQPLVDTTLDAAPAAVANAIPTDARTLVRISSVLQIGGGIMLVTGKAPRTASALLATTLVPTTILDGAFWSEPDPVRREGKRVALIKNVGLLGGLVIAAADTEGRPSLAWRGRRKAQEVQARVVSALPGHHDDPSAWDGFVERAQNDAQLVAERAADATAVARAKAGEVAATVADRAPEVAATAKHKAVKAAEVAAIQTAITAAVVAEKAPQLREDAAALGERAINESKRARKRAAKALEKARAEEARTKSALEQDQAKAKAKLQEEAAKAKAKAYEEKQKLQDTLSA